MTTAIVLIKTETAKVASVAQNINGIKGVSEVFSVAGQYDLVAIVRVASSERLAEVAGHHQAPSGVQRLGRLQRSFNGAQRFAAWAGDLMLVHHAIGQRVVGQAQFGVPQRS